MTIIQHRVHLKASTILTNLLLDYINCNDSINLIIKGGPGLGKTFLVRNIAKQMGLKLLEINSAQQRDFKTLKKILNESIKNKAISFDLSAMIVFIDDIDVILETELNFLKGLKWILSQSKCPVLMTCCNVPHDFKTKNIHVLNLEKSIDLIDLINSFRNQKNVKITNLEILYLFRFYAGNLHSVFNNLLLPVFLI